MLSFLGQLVLIKHLQVGCWNAVDEVLAVQQLLGAEVLREQLIAAEVLREDQDLQTAYPEVGVDMIYGLREINPG